MTSLQFETKRAFLEAVYAVYPNNTGMQVNSIFAEGKQIPKLFSMCAVYLLRADSAIKNLNGLNTIHGWKNFPGYDTVLILNELWKYLHHYREDKKRGRPILRNFFVIRKTSDKKSIYSFQRWNRNYPGLAIVQFANGHFARTPGGKLKVFQQLARSGSDLPYFITNGSTPQGIYSITGMDISHNLMIGPTPNIQLIMPFEDRWEKFFPGLWNGRCDSTAAVSATAAVQLEKLPADDGSLVCRKNRTNGNHCSRNRYRSGIFQGQTFLSADAYHGLSLRQRALEQQHRPFTGKRPI